MRASEISQVEKLTKEEAEEVDIVRVSCVSLRKADIEKWWWFEIKKWNIRMPDSDYSLRAMKSYVITQVNQRKQDYIIVSLPQWWLWRSRTTRRLCFTTRHHKLAGSFVSFFFLFSTTVVQETSGSQISSVTLDRNTLNKLYPT